MQLIVIRVLSASILNDIVVLVGLTVLVVLVALAATIVIIALNAVIVRSVPSVLNVISDINVSVSSLISVFSLRSFSKLGCGKWAEYATGQTLEAVGGTSNMRLAKSEVWG